MDDTEYDDPLCYDEWIEDAMRSVIYKALKHTETHGLTGTHHFYITVVTGPGGVVLPQFLAKRYPDDMTLVLQHRFDDLRVHKDGFQVTLFFGGKPVTLDVDFDNVIAFRDPAVHFGVRFSYDEDDMLDDFDDAVDAEGVALEFSLHEGFSGVSDTPSQDDTPPARTSNINRSLTVNGNNKKQKTGDVVTLDSFRKAKEEKNTPRKSKE